MINEAFLDSLAKSLQKPHVLVVLLFLILGPSIVAGYLMHDTLTMADSVLVHQDATIHTLSQTLKLCTENKNHGR